MSIFLKRIVSLLLVCAILTGLLPAMAPSANAAELTDLGLAGKTISILGDSISTYADYSNGAAAGTANSTIGNNDVYYTEGRHGVYLKDTWWQQTIDALGMQLLVNNSWSGSCVFMPRKGEASVGYGDRAINLHNDHTGEEPDIIFVYLGSNDFAYYKDTFGKAADVDYAALIQDHGDGTFTYAVPRTTCEAYAIMLHKVENRYPNAEIYCMTSTARRDPDYADNYADTGQPTKYSAELHNVAKYFGFPVIDLENCIPKEAEIFDQYMGDKRAHPNALGMDRITNEVLSVMLGRDAEICHVTSENGIVAEQAVLLGGTYATNIAHQEDYSVVVTMDGEDVTAKVYNDGKIYIEEVTGDIVVTATVKREPKSYRWELQDGLLVSTGETENTIVRLEGTTENGIFIDTRYQLTQPFVLLHDQQWVLEWKMTGPWVDDDSTVGKKLFSEDGAQATVGAIAIGTKSNEEWLAINYNNGTSHVHYGIDLAEYGISLSDRHKYRLYNKVAEDGSNMIWLAVDGVELGAMNTQLNTGKESTWVSGQDFSFGYLGTPRYFLDNGSIDYIQVWEAGEPEKEEQAPQCQQIAVLPGQLVGDTGEIIESDVYGYVVNYELKKGHILFISDTDYVFSVRRLVDGNYSQMLKQANTSGFVATEDMTVGMLIRKPDKSAVTEEELASIVIYDYANKINYEETALVPLYWTIPLLPGQLIGDTGEIVENEIYGYVVNYQLRKGHTLSINDTDYVFSIRQLVDGNYATLLKSATTDSFTAMEDMTVGMLIRKPDNTPLTEDELASIFIYDSQYGMVGVEGYAHRFTVEAETIDGGTATTRANIFLPRSYTADGVPTKLIVMTNGYSAHLTDSVWNKNTADNVNVIDAYLQAGYAVWVVDNTAASTSQTPDLGCPQLVSSYLKAHEYIQRHLNVEEKFSIHSRSFGTFAAMRIMQEVPELVKCGVMTGPRVSLELAYSYVDKTHVANRFGFEDATGTTYEADKLVGYNPYVDVDGDNYALPPTFWVLAEGDATEEPITVIEKLVGHGNNVISKIYTDIDHTGICTLNQAEPLADVLAYLQVWEGGEPSVPEEPTAPDYSGKVISIMGDSISTFAGYIPVADGYNREHLARYPQDDLLTDVNETWWMQVIAALDAKLGVNESWRGSTLSGAVPVTTGDTGENAAMSNLIRIQNMGSNGTPDVILLYGGTNDLAHVSKIGTFDPETAPAEADLTTRKWDNMADGFAHTLLRMRFYYPDAIIVALLPTYTASYYSDEKLEEGNAVLAQICEHYNIPYVDLRDSGVTAEHLPDGIHPGEAGMDLITQAVLDTLLSRCEVEPGENVVYSVSHRLTNVAASLGHYKGVSAGKAFEEILSGEELIVTVTMGGVDITDNCYADGKISIGEVTGDLVITAEGTFLGNHLQRLPDRYWEINLWPVLDHDDEYYTSTGWGTHSSGQVKSVTIPVTSEHVLYASSFGESGTNGGTANGIRVTFFTNNGVLVSMAAEEVHKQFREKGYLTVPENAAAVCVPMWTDAEDWELYVIPSFYLHLQEIPAGAYNTSNLWQDLAHDAEYYTSNGWGVHGSGCVKSVTIPVTAGDQLWATSFGAAGENGGSMDGIRVTYFADNGVLVSMTADEVYTEFSERGYLTVPENAAAVCIPMWAEDNAELYVLTLPEGAAVLKGYTYTLDEENGTVTLTKYTGAEADITVEAKYMVDGKIYATALDTSSVFRGNNSITSVKIDAGVGFRDDSMAYLFSECKKLTAVDMTGVDTSAVTDMSCLFDWCNALTTINGYEAWNTGAVQSIYKAFNRTSALTKVDLSAWDLSQVINSGWCFQLCMASEILLPDNLKTISAGFLNHATEYAGTTFTIPAGVEKIGYAHTIYDFATNDFVEFKVAEGNAYYVAIDGILYSADGTEMLAIPRNKTFEGGIYEIPEGVNFLGELSFSRNYNIHTVVLPNSLVIRNVPLNDPEYIVYEDVGNINAGNSLSIAIYSYTGITEYAVKDDNPNYVSLDGILYSKDLTTVVAVPSRYDQYMDIPEGVTAWLTEAMWTDASSTVDELMANCAGVSIPASLTDIAVDQIAKLNRLNAVLDSFVILVSPENPVYCVGEEGNLVTHSYTSEVTDPTCTELGYTSHTCTNCGDTYVDTYVKALSHKEMTDKAVAETCTTTGLTEGKHCERCGEVLVAQTVVKALGHDEVTDKAVAATCTETGLTEGKHCDRCGEVLVAQIVVNALGHDEVTDKAVAATCTTTGLTEGKHCDRCGEILVAQTVVKALGHIEVTDKAVAATCTETGLAEGKHCDRCGEVLVAQTVVNALGHDEVTDKAVAATCTTTGLTEGKHCERCGEILVAQTVVNALGHDEVIDAAIAATCTTTGLTEGKHCDRCGEVLVAQQTVPAEGHTTGAEVTCTESQKCTICGEVLKAALGHDLVHHEAKTPTYTEIGWNAYDTCTRCDYTTYTELPVLDGVQFVGASLSLKGDIGLNFFAIIPDEIRLDENAVMRFTVGNTVKTVPLSLGTLDPSDGSYRYSIALNAKNMGDEVTAQVYICDTPVGGTKTLSIKTYADYAIANSSNKKLVNLMKAMLNYGAAAQMNFGYDTENLVNADMAEADCILPETLDVSGYVHTWSGEESGLEVTNASLLLQSETKIRIYFKLKAGYELSDFSFTVDGVEVTPVKSGDEYYIEKPNVAAKDLDTMYTFCLGGRQLVYCGMSYVNQVLAYSSDENLINLAKALYAYNQAANVYFDK